MSVYTSSRRDAHKRERERDKYTVGASGTSATARARDARRDATLAEMGITTTTTADVAKATATAASGSGYVPTYGANSLYTSAGNTGQSAANTGQSVGGSAGGTSTVSNRSGYSGKTVGANTNYSGGRTRSRSTGAGGYGGSASVPYRTGMSDYDIQVRQDYYDRKAATAAANEAKKANYLQAMEEQTQADHNKRVRQKIDEIEDLYEQSVPIAQRATYENANGSRQHDYFLQNQILDAKIGLKKLNGAGAVISGYDINDMQDANNRKKSEIENDLWDMNNITADDLDGMSREEYLAGAQANLEKVLELDAERTGLVKDNKALERIRDYQSRYYADNAGGQFNANNIDARLDQDINLAYSDYLDDPTLQNWEYVQKLVTLQEQFQKNNTQTLDENAVNPRMSLGVARNIPYMWDGTKAIVGGAAVGLGVGLAKNALTPGKATGEKAWDVVDTAWSGGEAAYNTYARNVAKGSTMRELTEAGVDREIAAKAAETEETISWWIDTAGGIAEDGISKVIPKVSENPNIVDFYAKKNVGRGLGIPADMLKEYVHKVIIENAKSGNVDSNMGDILREAIYTASFMKGFDKPY